MNLPETSAEELAADVLMVVNQKLRTFQIGAGAKLTTWIFTIAKNRAIDFHRSPKPDFCELNDAAFQAREKAVSDQGGRNESLLRWLQGEMKQLTDQDQQILKWRALDYPFVQIAEWLGMTEGNARVRHKRSLDKLKEAANPKASRGASQS